MKILDDRFIKYFIKDDETVSWAEKVSAAHQKINEKTGAGNGFLGWVDLPVNYNKAEYERLKAAAGKIRNGSRALIVIGIGGSYLGSKAVLEAVGGDEKTEIYFSGNNLSSRSLDKLFRDIGNKDVSVNVISKSGTTTEPALAFRIIKEWMESKYGNEASGRIFATTDEKKGALKEIATANGYECFTVPDDVGGRYSVLTPVGLLPLAAAGINCDDLLAGAAEARSAYQNGNITENECYKYAVYRNILYKRGKVIEILGNYEPDLHFLGEWWKQLFGESEGKDNKGIFPATVDFTADLHSMGQFIQDGNRNLFESILDVTTDKYRTVIKKNDRNDDGLNYLAGKTLDEINHTAMDATLIAHTDAGVPQMVFRLPDLSARTLGYIIYFMEKACGISGYLMEVNPFDQPGVEAYKNNFFALLGKQGWEKEKEKIEGRL